MMAVSVNKSSIRNKLIKAREGIINSIIQELAFIGEECVRIARQKGNYNDITGNLRSSIAYVVLRDGETVINGSIEDFRKNIKSEVNGIDEGQKLLEKLKTQFPSGLVLIVCAGMNYAYYVEYVHDRDVLASSKLVAESMMKDLKRRIRQNQV